jgi:hypothetical protein
MKEADVGASQFAAILPLIRLLARQAAREDYERGLEAQRANSYSMERARGERNVIEDD